MPAPNEWGDVATTCTRDQVVAVYRHPFLYSTQPLVKPPRPQGTAKLDINTQLIPLLGQDEPRVETSPICYPVLKVQTAFPSMITVGRTANNDVCIDDVQLSRFHAFFRQNGKGWELADAGSLNGTKLTGKALEPKGPPREIKPGDVITFGAREFVFMTASACWDRLIDAMDHWDS